jgi:hypothetical protein
MDTPTKAQQAVELLRRQQEQVTTVVEGALRRGYLICHNELYDAYEAPEFLSPALLHSTRMWLTDWCTKHHLKLPLWIVLGGSKADLVRIRDAGQISLSATSMIWFSVPNRKAFRAFIAALDLVSKARTTNSMAWTGNGPLVCTIHRDRRDYFGRGEAAVNIAMRLIAMPQYANLFIGATDA